jgi:hypothetical protein
VIQSLHTYRVETSCSNHLKLTKGKLLKAHHPKWGKNEDQKHNALFLLDEISSNKAKTLFQAINPEYESVSFADGVVFWSGSKEHYTKTSYVKHLVKSPLYKRVTIGNSNASF